MTASAVESTGSAVLARSICRALGQLGYVSLVEFPLANGRRADILALGRSGDLVIVEIKSSVADFRADRKWSAYRDFSDRLYFAVTNDFPRPLIPDECGLMVADSFSAAVLRDGSTTRLDPGRRRALTMRFARIAATRLRRLLDPEAGRLAECDVRGSAIAAEPKAIAAEPKRVGSNGLESTARRAAAGIPKVEPRYRRILPIDPNRAHSPHMLGL